MTFPELAGLILMALGLAVVILGFVGLCLAVWFVVAADRQDAHWPDGLDEDPTLDVQSHIGDSRPLQSDRDTAYRRWETF